MNHVTYVMHNITGAVCGLVMRRTSFRFSKDYRHQVTRPKSLVYALVNTVAANCVANGDDCRSAIFWGYPRQSKYYRKGEQT